LHLSAAIGGIDAVVALMAAVVGVEGLEEAHTPAILGEGMTDSGQGRFARRIGGCAHVMPSSLS